MGNAYTTLKKVIKDLQELIPKNVDGFLKHFMELQNFGFFDGIFDLGLMGEIIKRIEDCDLHKKALADQLIEDLETNYLTSESKDNFNLNSIFIESGSTLAYYAQALRKKALKDSSIKSSKDKPLNDSNIINDVSTDGEKNYLSEFGKKCEKLTVVTNNFFVQTLLFQIFGGVRLSFGYLRKSYLAYVPFADNDWLETHLNKETVRISDRTKFWRLDPIISSCDTIYMTASTFGFIIGPSTRSRDNAIFKYCLLNNKARRPIKFCITEPKVFRNSSPTNPNSHTETGDYFWNKESNNKHSIAYHLKECFFVFDIPLACDGNERETSNGECFNRIKAHGFKPSSHCIDSVVLQDTNVCRGNTDTKCAEKEGSKKIHFRSVPSTLGLEYNRGLMEKEPIFGCYGTWLEYLDSQPNGNVEIFIGCSSSTEIKTLKLAFTEANRIIKDTGYGFQYADKTESSSKVLKLIVSKSSE